MLRLWNWLLNRFFRVSLAGLAVVFLAGMVFWGAFNWSLELTNTQSFCISCHEMRDTVYAEYQGTIHDNNRTGVRATCPDCHVPREWIHKVARKIGATNELFHWLVGSIDTAEKFAAKRPQLAGHVWASMKASDSRECRNCHGIDFMNTETQPPKARIMHALAQSGGETCIDCHKGIAHRLPQGFDNDALMDRLHERMEDQRIGCRQCHTDMAGPPEGQGW